MIVAVIMACAVSAYFYSRCRTAEDAGILATRLMLDAQDAAAEMAEDIKAAEQVMEAWGKVHKVHEQCVHDLLRLITSENEETAVAVLDAANTRLRELSEQYECVEVNDR